MFLKLHCSSVEISLNPLKRVSYWSKLQQKFPFSFFQRLILAFLFIGPSSTTRAVELPYHCSCFINWSEKQFLIASNTFSLFCTWKFKLAKHFPYVYGHNSRNFELIFDIIFLFDIYDGQFLAQHISKCQKFASKI